MSGQSRTPRARTPMKGRSTFSKNKKDVIVIDDEEPIGGKPPEKRAKVEEVFVCPLPPSLSLVSSPKLSNVAVLQQKLEKSERMYQKACAVARKEQLRAEHAESLLDNKQDVKKAILDGSAGDDGLEKKLAEATKQLEASRERANNAVMRNMEVVRERDAFKEEAYDLRCTIHKLDGEIHNQRTSSGNYFNNSELSHDYFELKTNLDQAKVAEGNMTRALTAARQENIGLQIAMKEMKRREEEEKKKLVSQLASASPTIRIASQENIALKAEMNEMERQEEEDKMSDLARENSALRTELDEARRMVADADVIKCGLLQANYALKKNLDDAYRTVHAVKTAALRKEYQLQQQLQKIRCERQSRMSASPSIETGAQQWVPLAPQLVSQPAGLFAGPTGPQIVQRVRQLAETAHPTNLLEPCHPFAIDSIPLEDAIAEIEAKFGEYRMQMRCLPSVSKMQNYFKKYRLQSMNLFCPLCDKRIENHSVLFHFKGHQHMSKARAHNSAVSEPALRYWLRKLQQAADEAAAEAGAAEAADAAAAGAAVVAAFVAAPTYGAMM